MSLQFPVREALTFDDVLLVPGKSAILPGEVSLRAQLTRRLWLSTPLLSAAMDTVTEARMAIALAREGGIGVIHRNLSIERQVEEVDKVKRSESGMIVDPITLPPTASLSDAEAIMSRYHISGVPIVEDGSRLVGILTNRDVRFAEDLTRPVSEFMTKDNLVTAPLGTTLEQAKAILQRRRIEKLPLVDESGVLRGLITVKDIQKKRDYPNAALDEGGRLLAAAAIGVTGDAKERLDGLIRAGVDLIVVDTAHGHASGVLAMTEYVKGRFPAVQLISGNVVTAEGTLDLIAAGADAVKIGVGAGSICTTRIVAGVGVPQITAISDCAAAAREQGVPIIADGGVKYSGDIAKALAAGANTIMLGNLLAGLEESPGETVLFEGKYFKDYRGMGSLGAMAGYGRIRYGTGTGATLGKLVPEGVEGRVPYKGHLSDYVFQLLGGVRSGMGYVGAASIAELQETAQFVRISGAGLVESHPHDVIIVKEPPNYQVWR